MNAISRKERIEETARKLIIRNDFIKRGISINRIEIKGNNNIIIKIYLQKDSGISIEDCTEFHREYILVLRAEELWDDNIRIEVSSPGISEQSGG